MQYAHTNTHTHTHTRTFAECLPFTAGEQASGLDATSNYTAVLHRDLAIGLHYSRVCVCVHVDPAETRI